ncbi:MAG: DinB family protein [Gemmatimonadetes bacterium]|nr:DinB family protein [Gemmatimonadota bacterium]
MGAESIPPQLAAIAHEHDRLDGRVLRLLAATPDARWARRNDAASWSVAECFAHLNLSSAAMVPRLRSAWTEARALGAAPARYKASIFGAILTAMVGPLPRLGRFRLGRVRTPAPFIPQGALPRGAILKEFAEWQGAERGLLREAASLPIDRVRIESPFAPGMFYDGYSSLRIMVRHALRHIEQAERVWGGS